MRQPHGPAAHAQLVWLPAMPAPGIVASHPAAIDPIPGTVSRKPRNPVIFCHTDPGSAVFLPKESKHRKASLSPENPSRRLERNLRFQGTSYSAFRTRADVSLSRTDFDWVSTAFPDFARRRDRVRPPPGPRRIFCASWIVGLSQLQPYRPALLKVSR